MFADGVVGEVESGDGNLRPEVSLMFLEVASSLLVVDEMVDGGSLAT